jgi:hypothetical protein
MSVTHALNKRVGVPAGTQLQQQHRWLAESGRPLPAELPPSMDAESEPGPNEVRVLCMYLADAEGRTDLAATTDFYLRAIAERAKRLDITINLGKGTRYFWGELRPAQMPPEPGLYYYALDLGERNPFVTSLGASIGNQMMAGRRPAGIEVLAFLAHCPDAVRLLAETTFDEIPLAGLRVGLPNGVAGTYVPIASGRATGGRLELLLSADSPGSKRQPGWLIPTVQPVL